MNATQEAGDYGRGRTRNAPYHFQASLQLATSAATTRASEAQQLYGSAAELLDKHRQGEHIKDLPIYMKTAFLAFCDDTSRVAQRHFEAYIRGTPRPPSPYMITNIDSSKTPPSSAPSFSSQPPSQPRSGSRSYSLTCAQHLSTHPPMSYAHAAAKLGSSISSAPGTSTPKLPPQGKKAPAPDIRLFVAYQPTTKLG